MFVCKNVTGRRWHSGWRLHSRSHAPREPHHYTHAADFAWYGVMYRHKTWRCFWCYIYSACWHNETDNRNKVSCYKHVDGWEHQGTMSIVHFFEEIGILIPKHFPISSWTKWEILIPYRNEKNDLHWSNSSHLSGCTKALCPLHLVMKVSSPAIDLIPRPALLLYDKAN